MTFQTEIRIEDLDKKIDAKGMLSWEIELDCRTWGVKDFGVHVPDQKISVTYSKEDENGDYIDVDAEIEVKDCKVEADISLINGDMAPQILQIFKGKQVVEF